MIWWKVNPRDDVIIFEEWPREEFYGSHFTGGAPGYARLIQEIENGDNSWGQPIHNVTWRIMDPNFGRTPEAATGESLQDTFSNLGLWFDCSVPNRINDGHIIVQGRLDQQALLFTPNCTNTIKAMERYVYDEFRDKDDKNPKEKPKEAYKDGADVVRYTCVMNPHWFPIESHLPPPRPMINMGLGQR